MGETSLLPQLIAERQATAEKLARLDAAITLALAEGGGAGPLREADPGVGTRGRFAQIGDGQERQGAPYGAPCAAGSVSRVGSTPLRVSDAHGPGGKTIFFAGPISCRISMPEPPRSVVKM